MTYSKLILILFFSFLCSFNSSAQDAESEQNYAEIVFVPWTGKAYRNHYCRIFLNSKLITPLKMNELVKYKIYSKGRLVFNIYFSETERYETMIEVDENKTYYCVLGAPYKKQKNKMVHRVLAEEMMNEFSYVKTIELEEDITKPIGKLPKDFSAKKGAGSGTGFLLSDKGYIATNFHVVDGAETITVRGINGEYGSSFEASVVSLDHANDLAILKINSTLINFPTPPYSIQSSKAVKKGETVYALGYPIKDLMGNELKVTNGIINAASGYKGSISQFQFSAAVQPGNSGGPLINSEGNIIGVVSSKLNPKLAESASYAIKSDYLSFFVDQSKKIEYVPTKNTLKGEDLPEQLEKISKFIYIIETK